MSHSSNQENAFAQIFFKNFTSSVVAQIKNNYKNTSKSTNSDFSRLTANVESLTSHMKEVLKNESTCRPILGKNENDDFEKGLNKADKSIINHSLRTTLVETDSNSVTIVQSFNSDPLYSVKSFEQLKLKPELLNGIESMNFRKPSSIQEKALPILFENRNLIAQSQSGTGKTATFLLNILTKIDVNDPFCQCLCMAPTRELVIQISDVAKTMAKFMNKVKITCAIKGVSPPKLNDEIDSQLIIGTPGTLKYWTTENSQLYFNPKRLKVFVLDEADVLIENPEFLNIAKRIKSKVTNNCQILLFSATYDNRVMDFAYEFVPNFTELTMKPQELTLKNIKQYYIKMESPENKYPTLIEIYGMKSMGQCIIFCESRKMALFLQRALEKDSNISSLLSGELDVISQQEQLDDFRNGKSRVLIVTNLCFRGIDIPQVNLIINWDMPKTKEGHPDCETYLHRIGRSGRFGKTGLTINFIVTETDMQIQHKIIETFGSTIEEMTNLEVISKI